MRIDTSSPVMVTSATGYVAGWIVRDLLEAGVTVHAPVRDLSRAHIAAAYLPMPRVVTSYRATILPSRRWLKR